MIHIVNLTALLPSQPILCLPILNPIPSKQQKYKNKHKTKYHIQNHQSNSHILHIILKKVMLRKHRYSLRFKMSVVLVFREIDLIKYILKIINIYGT